jgi:DNA-binding CsgD family transcriptional regulator
VAAERLGRSPHAALVTGVNVNMVVSSEAMPSLTRGDAERLLRFVSVTGASQLHHQPFTPDLLVELGRLVPADSITYLAEEVDGWVDATRPGESDEERGIAVNELPSVAEIVAVCRSEDPIAIRRLNGSRETLMFSDFFTQRQLRRMSFHAEYLRFYDVNHRISFRVPADPHVVVLFDRKSLAFEERDRLVLDLLQPHLGRIYAGHVQRCRGVVGARLTARETEVLELVADGKTNGEIANALWVSPGTVRKHLENAFAKLGVHTRTAAATRFLALADADRTQPGSSS